MVCDRIGDFRVVGNRSSTWKQKKRGKHYAGQLNVRVKNLPSFTLFVFVAERHDMVFSNVCWRMLYAYPSLMPCSTVPVVSRVYTALLDRFVIQLFNLNKLLPSLLPDHLIVTVKNLPFCLRGRNYTTWCFLTSVEACYMRILVWCCVAQCPGFMQDCRIDWLFGCWISTNCNLRCCLTIPENTAGFVTNVQYHTWPLPREMSWDGYSDDDKRTSLEYQQAAFSIKLVIF